MTSICVPITVESIDDALDDAREAQRLGAHLVEWRIDSIFAGASSDDAADARLVQQFQQLIEASPLPCILTCRLASEGGDYDADDADRISLFEKLTAASTHPPRYLDVEWSSYARSANLARKVRLCVEHPRQLRDLKTSLILSTHDFQTRPADLLRRLLSMRDEPAASVVKVAFRARSLHDSLELLDLPAQLAKPTIALGIGEFGLCSRILAPKFGAFLTFAALRKQAATAPGQPTLLELNEQYRFKQINPATRVYGIIGFPVSHSLSPKVHNACFAQANKDSVYVHLPIAGYDDPDLSYASFRAALMELIEHPRLDFSGASITMPHKTNLARLAREAGWSMDEPTRATSAANTLIVRRDAQGKPIACEVLNTDVAALQTCMRSALSHAPAPQGHADPVVGPEVGPPLGVVAVVGAGGVGLAAAYAALSLGHSVVLYNRDEAKAQRAATHLRQAFAPAQPSSTIPPKIVAMGLDALPKACAHVFVQATSVGMNATNDETTAPSIPISSPIPIDRMTACLRDGQVPTLIETIYNPVRTPAIVAAHRAGWRTIDGPTIFIEQATGQARAWLATEPDRDLIERLVRGALPS